MPLVTEILDHAGDVQGPLSTTKPVTDDKTPEFKGTAEAGSLVIIYIWRDGKGIEAGRYQLAENQTNWSIKLSVPLTEGSNTIYIEARDKAGNVSNSNHIEATLDTIAPEGPKIEHVTNSEGREVENNGYINDQTPIFRGKGEKDTVITFIEILADGTEKVLGTTVTSGWDNSWTFRLPDNMKLSEGTHTIKVSQTDKAGNVNHLVVAKFVVHVILLRQANQMEISLASMMTMTSLLVGGMQRQI